MQNILCLVDLGGARLPLKPGAGKLQKKKFKFKNIQNTLGFAYFRGCPGPGRLGPAPVKYTVCFAHFLHSCPAAQPPSRPAAQPSPAQSHRNPRPRVCNRVESTHPVLAGGLEQLEEMAAPSPRATSDMFIAYRRGA